MSSYKSFALVGFGGVGTLVLDEFLKEEAERSGRGYKLRVLTRSKDKPELTKYTARGVDIVEVDYASLESVTQALKGVEVVLSFLSGPGLALQKNVARGAKAAGVKLFAPSEYGKNTLGATDAYLGVKAETHVVLKELSLPYVLFFTGLFPDTVFPNVYGPLLGVDLEAGKFILFGDGNVPISWTSPHSIAPFVHHVLTTLPASQLQNRIFNIEGDRKTFREVIAIWEAKHGKPAQVIAKNDEEVQKWQDEQTSVVPKLFSSWFRDGSILNGGKDNGLYPEWKPLKWEDVMP